MKEDIKGENLVEYLQELFQSLVGADNIVEIKLESALRIGYKGHNIKRWEMCWLSSQI